MVRETRHLWVGNLPDNIREDRIREHFKRYGRVQSVKLLPPRHPSTSSTAQATALVPEDGASVCAAVAFMDIKSASKAHTAEHKLDERCLTTEYYEPATAPTAILHIHDRDDGLIRGAGAPGAEVGGAGGTAPLYPPPRSPRFPHGPPAEESFDRSSHFYRGVQAGAGGAEADPAYLRRPPGYLANEGLRGRARDRLYRNGPYPPHIEPGGRGAAGGSHHRGGSGGSTWNYDGGGGTGRYPATPSEPPTFPEESAVPPVSGARQPPPPAASVSPASSPALPCANNPSPGHLSAVSARKSKRSKHKRVSRGGSGSDSEHSSSRSSSRSSSSTSGSSSSTSRSSRSRSPAADSSRSCSPSGRPRRYLASISSHHNNLHSNPSTHAEDRRPLAICVRNLPTRSSDTSLKDGLFHEYKKHGKVTWVKVVGQGGDRYAVVCFKKPDDVDKALEVSQDKLFFGCKIDVHPYEGFDVEDNDIRSYEAELDEFHPKATRTLFIGNLEKDITASELRKHFEQYGEIIEIDIKKQGSISSYAFCQYADIGSVVKAMRNMDGEHLGNNRIKLGFGKSMPTNCVWVDGVAETVSENYLTMQFLQFGAIVQIVIDRERGHALVFFEQISCAQNAVKEMRGVTLRGRKLQIDFASRECQEAFYNHLESQGHTGSERPWERRDANLELRETPVKRFEAPAVTPAPQRFPRYEGTPRAVRGAALHRGGVNATPSTRPAVGAYTGPVRTNSQGSAGHEDSYEQELRDYGFCQRERRDFDGSPGFVRHEEASPAAVAASEGEEGAPGRRRSRQRSTASDQESPPVSRHPSPSREKPRYTATSYTRLIPHSRSPSTPALTSPLREVVASSYYEEKEGEAKCKDSSSVISATPNSNVNNNNKCDLKVSGALPHRLNDVLLNNNNKEGTFRRHSCAPSVEGGDSKVLECVALPPPTTPGVEGTGSEIKHLQKERVHIQQLLQQLGESHSSGDESSSNSAAALAKRLKLNSSDVSKLSAQGLENDSHSSPATFRKMIEPRRLSDLKGRRISTDSYSKSGKEEVDKYHARDYATHFIPKRRKTESSSEPEERLGFLPHRLREESEHHVGEKVVCHRDSSDSSRPGTPLCDERPENLPTEPRRQRDKSTDGPISLPLPKFAHQILSPRPSPGGATGKVIYTIKSPPACVHRHRDSTSSRGSGPEERRPSDVLVNSGEAGSPSLAPLSPQPMRPESSSESEISPRASPTLEERIRIVDEKYEKWLGSRTLSSVSLEAIQKTVDAEKFKARTKLLDLNELRSQPSEIVKSVLAKRSVFDEDSKRLENVNEKYEPKEFGSTWSSKLLGSSASSPLASTVSVATSPLKNLKTEVKEVSKVAVACVSPAPKSILVSARVSPSPLLAASPTVPTLTKPTPTPVLKPVTTPKSDSSPRSTSPRPSAAKGLQYPFPSHPPASGGSVPACSTPAVSLVTASQLLASSPGVRNSLSSCQPPLSSPVQSASPAVVSTSGDLTASASDWTSRLDSSPVVSTAASSNNIPRSSPTSSYLPTPPPSVCSSPSVCSVSSQANSSSKSSPPATPEAPSTTNLPSATPASALPGNHKEPPSRHHSAESTVAVTNKTAHKRESSSAAVASAKSATIKKESTKFESSKSEVVAVNNRHHVTRRDSQSNCSIEKVCTPSKKDKSHKPQSETSVRDKTKDSSSAASTKPAAELERKESTEHVERRKESGDHSERRKDVSEPLERRKDISEPLERRKDVSEPLERRKDASEPLERRKESGDHSERRKDVSEPLERRKDVSEPLERRKDVSEPLERRKDVSEPLERRKDVSEPLERRKDVSEPLERRKDASEPLERRKESGEHSDRRKEVSEHPERRKDVTEHPDRRKEVTEHPEKRKDAIEQVERRKDSVEHSERRKEPVEHPERRKEPAEHPERRKDVIEQLERRKDGELPERRKDGEHPERRKDVIDHPERRKDGEHPERRKDGEHPERRKDGEHPERRKDAEQPERRKEPVEHPERRKDGEHPERRKDSEHSERRKEQIEQPERRKDSVDHVERRKETSEHPERRKETNEHPERRKETSEHPERRKEGSEHPERRKEGSEHPERRKEGVEHIERRKERRDSGKDGVKRESLSRTTSCCSSPASVGSKRRVSSQDSAESTGSLPSDPRHRNPSSKDVSAEPEPKRQKLSPSSSTESKDKCRSQKVVERRESKDGCRRVDGKRSEEKKSERKHGSDKERKPDEKSSSKVSDEKQSSHERKHESKSSSDGDKKKSKEHSESKTSHDREGKDSERHRSKDRDKQRKRNKSEREKESPTTSKVKEEKVACVLLKEKSPLCVVRSKEEMEEEEYKQAKRESRERKKLREQQQLQQLDVNSDLSDEKNKLSKRDKKCERRKEEEKMAKRKERALKKRESGGSDSDLSEDGRMKKHSIFDIVDDEPAYISMYDKVKARSTKNMQKQEEEKQKEKLKEKFNQLKQSRAKREEKKRSTSWDEDSDSDLDKERSKPSKRSNKLVITSSSEDESCNKSERSGRSRYESGKSVLRLSDISHDGTDKSDSELDSLTMKQLHKMRKEHRRNKLKSDGSEDDGSARTKFMHTSRKMFKSKITSDTSDYDDVMQYQSKPAFDIYSDSESEHVKKESPHESKIKSKESSRETFESSDEGIKFDKKHFVVDSSKYKNEFSENETPNTQSSERNHSNCIDKNSQRKSHKKNKKRLSSKKTSISVEKLPELGVVVEGELEVRLERLEDTRLKLDVLEQHKKHTSKRERKKSGHKTEDDKLKSDEAKDLHHEARANKIRKKRSKKNCHPPKSEPSNKRDDKMEDIFGPLSDDSETGATYPPEQGSKPASNPSQLLTPPAPSKWQVSAVYSSDSDSHVGNCVVHRSPPSLPMPTIKIERKSTEREESEPPVVEESRRHVEVADVEARRHAEERRRKRERKSRERREKKLVRVKTECLDDMEELAQAGRALESKLLSDCPDLIQEEGRQENKPEGSFDVFRFTDDESIESYEKPKEKKKKRKKSKEEKSRKEHHDKDHERKVRSESSPKLKDTLSPDLATKSLNKHFEELAEPIHVTAAEVEVANKYEDILLPVVKCDKKKIDKFIPGFGSEVDETIYENAVKSISKFEDEERDAVLLSSDPGLSLPSLSEEEKPRTVISQEEIDGAVASLFVEKFDLRRYSDEGEPPIFEPSSPPPELLGTAEEEAQKEIQQAVESLESEMPGQLTPPSDKTPPSLPVPEEERKCEEERPDTPQSEHDLQIDEEAHLASEDEDHVAYTGLRFDEPPKTPDINLSCSKTPEQSPRTPEIDFSRPPKTPDFPAAYYQQQQEKLAERESAAAAAAALESSSKSQPSVEKQERASTPVLPEQVPELVLPEPVEEQQETKLPHASVITVAPPKEVVPEPERQATPPALPDNKIEPEKPLEQQVKEPAAQAVHKHAAPVVVVSAVVEQPHVIVEKPTAPLNVEKPTAPLNVEKPTAPLNVEKPTAPLVVEKPPVVTVEKPLAPVLVEKPSAPEVVEKPSAAKVVEKPSPAENVEKLFAPEVVEKPSAAEVVEKPSAAENVEKPSAAEVVEKPSAAEVAEKPSTAEVVEKPSAAEAVVEKPPAPVSVEKSPVVVEKPPALKVVEKPLTPEVVEKPPMPVVVEKTPVVEDKPPAPVVVEKPPAVVAEVKAAPVRVPPIVKKVDISVPVMRDLASQAKQEAAREDLMSLLRAEEPSVALAVTPAVPPSTEPVLAKSPQPLPRPPAAQEAPAQLNTAPVPEVLATAEQVKMSSPPRSEISTRSTRRGGRSRRGSKSVSRGGMSTRRSARGGGPRQVRESSELLLVPESRDVKSAESHTEESAEEKSETSPEQQRGRKSRRGRKKKSVEPDGERKRQRSAEPSGGDIYEFHDTDDEDFHFEAKNVEKTTTSPPPAAPVTTPVTTKPEEKGEEVSVAAPPVTEMPAPASVGVPRRDSSTEEAQSRPRLILTIKSPMKEVPKVATREEFSKVEEESSEPEHVEEHKHGQPSPPSTAIANVKSPPGPTRKSRRLQEKDSSRNTVDDVIEEVIKGNFKSEDESPLSPLGTRLTRRSIRGRPKEEEPDKKPARQARASSLKLEEQGADKSKAAPVVVVEAAVVEPAVAPVTSQPPVVKQEVVKLVHPPSLLHNPNKPEEPTTLIDPVTGLLIPMRESEEGQYIPVTGASGVSVIQPRTGDAAIRSAAGLTSRGMDTSAVVEVGARAPVSIAQPPRSIAAPVTTTDATPVVLTTASTRVLPLVTTSTPRVAPLVTTSPPRVAPVVTTSPARVAPVVSSAPARVAPVVSSVAARVAPVVTSAPARVAPVVTTSPARVAPVVSSVAARVAPVVSSVAARVAPVVTSVPARVAPVVSSVSARVAPVVSSTPARTAPIASVAPLPAPVSVSPVVSRVAPPVGPSARSPSVSRCAPVSAPLNIQPPISTVVKMVSTMANPHTSASIPTITVAKVQQPQMRGYAGRHDMGPGAPYPPWPSAPAAAVSSHPSVIAPPPRPAHLGSPPPHSAHTVPPKQSPGRAASKQQVNIPAAHSGSQNKELGAKPLAGTVPYHPQPAHSAGHPSTAYTERREAERRDEVPLCMLPHRLRVGAVARTSAAAALPASSGAVNMEAPKVDVAMSGCIVANPPSPRGGRESAVGRAILGHSQVLQAGMPIPAFEASLHAASPGACELGGGAQLSPAPYLLPPPPPQHKQDLYLLNAGGSAGQAIERVPNRPGVALASPPPAHQGDGVRGQHPPPHLRPPLAGGPPPHDMPHNMLINQQLIYQQMMRAQHEQQQHMQHPYHLPPGAIRSPAVPSLDKAEQPEASDEVLGAQGSSPPLELRRPGSRGRLPPPAPAHLHSPHDRATDSPQVATVYGARLVHHGYTAGMPRADLSDKTMAPLAHGLPQRPFLYEDDTYRGPPPAHHHRPGGIIARVHPTPGQEAPPSQVKQQPRMQVQTPPHASQVPPQADSLLMLLQRYPVMWQGLLALKNDQAAVQMHFVYGNPSVARESLPCNSDGSTPPLRIAQRMRLEQTQLEGVARKMQMENEHCMLLALPCGRDHMDVLQQSNNLTTGFITYLQQKQAAGIVNIAAPGSQQAAYVVHIFPSCEFANDNLARIAPDLLHRVDDIAHLLIIIATV